MNERLIFNLAKQADPGYTGIDDDNMGHALVGYEAIEKFAQLIVRECASISNQAEKQCQHPATQIMKHFGVE